MIGISWIPAREPSSYSGRCLLGDKVTGEAPTDGPRASAGIPLQGEGHSPRTSRSEGKGRFQLLPSRAVGLDQWGFCSQKHKRWEIGHQNTAGSHLLFQGQAMEQAEVWGWAPRSGLAGD